MITIRYNSAGIITAVSQGALEAGGESVLTVTAGEFANGAQVLQNPAAYQVQNGVLVPAPAMTAQISASQGVATVTVGLANPPATLPTAATVQVGTASTVSVPLTKGVGSFPVAMHETLGTFGVPLTVTAENIPVGATVTVNQGVAPPIDVQIIAPTTSGDPYVIGPTGTGAKTFCRQVAMGLTPETEMEILTLSAQNLYLTTAVGLSVLIDKILPWTQQTSWSALTLSAEEGAALKALPTDLTTYLPKLGGLVTANGDPAMPQVSEMLAQAPGLQASAANYAQWIVELGL